MFTGNIGLQSRAAPAQGRCSLALLEIIDATLQMLHPLLQVRMKPTLYKNVCVCVCVCVSVYAREKETKPAFPASSRPSSVPTLSSRSLQL
jgi:hypothetical protein